MKTASTSILKTKIVKIMNFFSDKANERIVKIENEIEGDENAKVVEQIQNETPQKKERKKYKDSMSEEQKRIAEKIKEEICNLHKQGFSTRMIAESFNDLYGKDVEIISRETVRKIIANQPVSLKSIAKLMNNRNF